GLIVAVDAFAQEPELGVAENAASGTSALTGKLNEIRAERGSVNLVGLTVRQNGNVNATTAVKGANGAVYLQAMETTTALAASGQGSAQSRGLAIEAGANVRVGERLGTVEIGAGSVTAVRPDSGST